MYTLSLSHYIELTSTFKAQDLMYRIHSSTLAAHSLQTVDSNPKYTEGSRKQNIWKSSEMSSVR